MIVKWFDVENQQTFLFVLKVYGFQKVLMVYGFNHMGFKKLLAFYIGLHGRGDRS
jgi:hypothetical protein